jgi:hypothetical protein
LLIFEKPKIWHKLVVREIDKNYAELAIGDFTQNVEFILPQGWQEGRPEFWQEEGIGCSGWSKQPKLGGPSKLLHGHLTNERGIFISFLLQCLNLLENKSYPFYSKDKRGFTHV